MIGAWILLGIIGVGIIICVAICILSISDLMGIVYDAATDAIDDNET